MSQIKERSVALNSNVFNTDSHKPTIVGFYSGELGIHSNLSLEEENVYTLIYPEPLEYSQSSIITKARGKFVLEGTKPWLLEATVWYANKPECSGRRFFVSILEGTIVENETTGEKITVQLPPDKS